MDLGTLASYLVYVRQSAMPLNQFTNQFNFLLAALSGAERIFDLMEQEPEIDEGTVTLCPVEVRMDGSLKEAEGYTGSFAWKDADSLTLLQGDVRFDQVVFGYTPEKTILNGISLYAQNQYPLTLERGDVILLCSDGLVNTVTDQEIMFEILHNGQPEDCLQRLMAISKQRGAPDNITAVLLLNGERR